METNKYSDNEAINELFERTHDLMEKRRWEIQNGAVSVYSLKVHEFLQKAPMMHANVNREIMLPMPREKWYPEEQFHSLEESYSETQLDWPRYSHIQYVMDYAMSSPFAELFAGYAVCGQELIPCTFFANFLLTQKIEGMTDRIPEYWVIDPIALIAGKKPECYIGVNIARKVAEEWYLERGEGPHFLEAQLVFDDQKRSDIFHGRSRASGKNSETVIPKNNQTPPPIILSDSEKSAVVNKKLKSIYFKWSINYEGPPPRSLAVTFEEHLYFERYEFCEENWLEKVMEECSLGSKREFDVQVFLIEELYEKYVVRQLKNSDKTRQKELKTQTANGNSDDLPF